MATFNFELVSPERVLFSGPVDAVILPATEGEMTVLAGHAPTMTTLKTGFLVVTDCPGNGMRILVRGGFADINPDGLRSGRTRVAGRRATHEILDNEILHAQMIYDATDDAIAKQAAEAAGVQLEDAKVA